jgi:hypothetical protein
LTYPPLSTGRHEAGEKTRENLLAPSGFVPDGVILPPESPRFNDFLPLSRLSPADSAFSHAL